MWFRVASDAVGRLQADTPGARGDRLIDALLAWLPSDDQLERDVSRFEVRVSDEGDIPVGGAARSVLEHPLRNGIHGKGLGKNRYIFRSLVSAMIGMATSLP